MVRKSFAQYSTYRGPGTDLMGLLRPKVAHQQFVDLQPRSGAAMPELPSAPRRTICLSNLVASIIVLLMSGARQVEKGMTRLALDETSDFLVHTPLSPRDFLHRFLVRFLFFGSNYTY